MKHDHGRSSPCAAPSPCTSGPAPLFPSAEAPVTSDAVLSLDGVYRYSLTRRWDPAVAAVRWIMLNPSTADAEVDDPTIRRCVGFARRWGYGGIVVHNLFALRATDPRELRQHPDPVGPDNDAFLRGERSHPLDIALTVCAWGANPGVVERGRAVLQLLADAGVVAHALGVTVAGHPKHPLYLPGCAEPVELAAALAGGAR